MERKNKWQRQGSLCYVLLSLGWRETGERLIYFNLTKRSGRSTEQEHRRITVTFRNLYANIRHSAHSTWMKHSIWNSLSPAFTETNENFWLPFVWITSARLLAKKKMENLVSFYGWYNQERIKGTEKATPIHTLFHR